MLKIMSLDSFIKALMFYIASEIFKTAAENIVKDDVESNSRFV